MGTGQGTYYVGLAREDYYLEGGEPPGVWVGNGAEVLGYTGTVEREQFLSLFAGFDQKGKGLVQNAGETHRPGWDLTFSAPKSVSVLWACGDQDLRQAIQEAHFKAVKAALGYLEEEAAYTRTGKAGENHIKTNLIIGTFEHGTSRAQEPQLHTHALIMNVGVNVGEDGSIKTRSLEAQPLYQHRITAGTLYQLAFAREMEGLDFSVERHGNTFEVKGIPESIIDRFSTRHKEIVEALEKRGEEGGKAASVAALDTRTVKEHIARSILTESWQETGEAHGVTPESIRQLREPVPERDNEIARADLRKALETAQWCLTQDKSHFSERDLLRTLAEECIDRGHSESLVRAAVRHEIETNKEIVYLGDINGERRYTTRELLDLEKQLLKDVDTLRQSPSSHGVSEQRLNNAIEKTEQEETRKARKEDPNAEARTMNKEQREALTHIAQEERRIAVVSGMAGTGKTFMLSAAREAWEANGYKVVGAAVAGKAARGLEEGAGINSMTLHKLVSGYYEREFDTGPGIVRTAIAEFKQATWQIDNKTKQKILGEYHKPTSTLVHEWKYATYQISRGHRDFLNMKLDHERQREKFILTDKTVVVIDEAGMVGTRNMARLIERVKEAGAKLVLVGDARQLQPVDVGGPFRAIETRIGSAKLTQIIRQNLDTGDRNPFWKREAVTDFAEGRAGKALEAYRERGFLSVSDDREKAMQSLVGAWKERGNAKPGENLIFAGTRQEVKELNRMAQAAREEAGKLGFHSARVKGTTIHEKDRVLITRTDSALDVDNGDLGTVKKLDQIRGKMLIKMDDGRNVSLPYKDFQDIELGYAMTTHKAQGATVKNSFILCGGAMADREISYVQASRAKEQTHLFTEKITVWNPNSECREDRTFAELSRQMSQNRQKDMAHDVAERQQVPERQLEWK